MPPSAVGDTFNVSKFLESWNDDVDGGKTEDEISVENASEHSRGYSHHRSAIMRSFLETLARKGKSWNDYLLSDCGWNVLTLYVSVGHLQQSGNLFW